MEHFTSTGIELSPQASWDENGVTVAGPPNTTSSSSLIQLNLTMGISISYNDVLYISDQLNDRVVAIDLNSNRNLFFIGSGSGSASNQFNLTMDLCASKTSLYVIDHFNARVQESLLNGSNPSTVVESNTVMDCHYLYVDYHEDKYLSDTANHRIWKFPSNSFNGTSIIGTGIPGTDYRQLNRPHGLFVDWKGTIYIADYANHRIMKWSLGDTNGTVAAGSGTNGTNLTELAFPTQVIVDTNDYMYISEGLNSRIIRWIPNATIGECIAACTGAKGLAANQLNRPVSIAFDSQGSLYVSDRDNNRIQKFQILPRRK